MGILRMTMPWKTASIAFVAGLLLAGCSETGFQDVMGSGKFSPDETQVRTNQSLALPPDLQLRAPGGGGAPVQPQQPLIASQQPVTPQPYGTPQPQPYAVPQQPAYQTYQPQQVAPSTVPQYNSGAPQQIGANAPQQPGAYVPQQQAVAPVDPYQKYGISRTHPDGRPKSQSELREEFRKVKQAEEAKKNANYGSIWNMGKVLRESWNE